MREIAVAWRGFDGVREYASLEGQLRLAFTHDGLGTIRCEVAVARLEPPEWSFSAVLIVGAGAHIEGFASDVEAFVA